MKNACYAIPHSMHRKLFIYQENIMKVTLMSFQFSGIPSTIGSSTLKDFS